VRDGFYPTTIWSEVERAGRTEASDSTAALETLLAKYYAPLQRHLQFKFQVDEDQARDWLQAFVHSKILLGRFLARASRDRGRFRTFLLNALDHFVISELRKANAGIRGSGQAPIPLEMLTASEELQAPVVPGDAFCLDWARAVLAEALKRMQAECRLKSHHARWGVFRARLLEPLLEGTEAPPYEQLVRQFGLSSPAEASNALVTGKRQFDRLLHAVVAEYAGDGAEVETELRELKRALSGTK